MALHILRHDINGQAHWALLEGTRAFALDLPCTTTGELISLGHSALAEAALQARRGTALQADRLALLSPVTTPARILCQGANYRQHMLDSGMDPDQKKYNMFFTKSSASVHTPQGDIVRPPHVQLLDYEIEMTLVLGCRTRNAVHVTANDLADYVAGICIGNDVSARDVQIPQMQFHKGKSYRTFCPLGPVLALLAPDEMHYLDEMLLTLTVNGERRQHDHTGNLVFRPAETISEYSQVNDLDPGDVILTGTPSGCALGLPSPFLVRMSALLPEEKKWAAFIAGQKRRAQYLQPGDRIESRIVSRDGRVDLGTQRHLVRDTAIPL